MPRHLDEIRLKACFDGQLAEGEQVQALAHLRECPACQSRYQLVREQSKRVHQRLAGLDPGPAEKALPAAGIARARFAARLSQKEKENQNMSRKIFSRPFRPVWAALALVLVIGLALSVPSVRAMAVNFLEIFRVKQIAVIPVDPNNLPASFKDTGPSIQKLLSDNVQYQETGKPTQVQSAEEASKQAGFNVRLSGVHLPLHSLTVTAATHGTFTLDVARINGILAEMNRSDLALAKNLDQSVVTVEVPASVTAAYGACEKTDAKAAAADPDQNLPNPMTTSDCTELVQVPSPTVTTPQGLDVNKLGNAFLEMAGIPAAKGANIDWSNTLVIPLPVTASEYEQVTVDGVNGTLVRSNSGRMYGHYVILWVKNGIVYAVSGNGDSNVGVELANSLH